MNLSKQLPESPIFSHLDAEAMDMLLQAGTTRTYEKGSRIVHYGDIWPYLFFVAEGRVTAVKESEEGRALIVVSLSAGEVFWGISFFEKGTPMIVSLIADEPSKLHAWSRKTLLPILLADGRMSWELARLMVKRMLHASDIVEELAFQPVTGRLARLLLQHFGAEAEEEYVERDLTLDEMAARIGTTREMVCRQLYRIMDKGAIQISRTDFKITNRAALEKIAAMTKGE
jgi:CRP-like cAMP-binding protein